jgi:putative Mg2+ transporter-C (MgtC) family protein
MSGDVLTGLEWLRIDLLVKLLIASILGGLVGLEREISDKPAGLRTNLLICVGAALLMDLSVLVARMADPTLTNADPARIGAQIVSGIGFLGAGSIIQARGSVRGLTTAATIWVVAAIGMTVGAGAYIEAIGTTILVIVVLVLLGRVERFFFRRRLERVMRIVVDSRTDAVERVMEILRSAGFSAEALEVEKEPGAYTAVYRVAGPRDRWARVMHELLAAPGVRKVTPR